MKVNLQTSPRRHLLIDGRTLTGGRNGITRFVEQLLQAWPVSPAFRTTVISNKPIVSNAVLPPGIDLHTDDGSWTNLPGTLWLQASMPAIAKRMGATDFLGPEHVLPLSVCGRLNTGVIVHDLVFERYPETMVLSNRLLSRFFAPRSIRAADRIFCVSESTRQDLEAYLGRRAQNAYVSYPGLAGLGGSRQADAISQGRDGVHLLIVGSMEPRKNIKQFLKIFLQLAQARSDVYLDIVSGGGWGRALEPELHERVRTHPRIHFHQGISDEKLDALYRKVDFLVFPSIYEGFGLPILEAVGKCAVIANDIPVFRELAAKIDGIDLCDFSVGENDAAQRVNELIATGTARSATIRPAFRDTFNWSNCANTIAAGMGLIENADSGSIMPARNNY